VPTGGKTAGSRVSFADAETPFQIGFNLSSKRPNFCSDYISHASPSEDEEVWTVSPKIGGGESSPAPDWSQNMIDFVDDFFLQIRANSIRGGRIMEDSGKGNFFLKFSSSPCIQARLEFRIEGNPMP
jgi:hypothetical protein